MKLLFVRHGETDWNVQKRIQGGTDIELNENGVAQARQLGEKIASQSYGIHKIYSSKLKRAYRTAEIIGECIQADVETIDGLEEMNLGLWEGMRWSEVRDKFPKEYQQWYDNRRYQNVPQGESYEELLKRVLAAVHQIMEKVEETVLIVTHSADIVTLLAVIHKTEFSDMFRLYKIRNADLVEIDSEEIEKITFS